MENTKTADTLRNQLMNQKMKVDFNTYDFSIKELISMVGDKTINISPAYQRHFRWDKERQSQLIESFFLGIPVPNLFMATNADSSWEVIDGVQRISTLINFAGTDEEREQLDVSGNKSALKLVGLDKLTEFNEKSFLDLPLDIQRKFKLTSIKVITLTDKSDMNVRFDLFERLNRGGLTLTDQEIRSCVYRGPFNDFLREMSSNTDFHESVHISSKAEVNGKREEYVLRFFAYLYDYKSFEHSVKDFLNDFMEKANKNFDYQKNQMIFCKVFETLNSTLKNGITNTSINITPANLFEGISVGAALAYKETGTINTDGINDWIKSDELKQYIAGATNSRKRVMGRIEFCKNKFEGR